MPVLCHDVGHGNPSAPRRPLVSISDWIAIAGVIATLVTGRGWGTGKDSDPEEPDDPD